MSETVYILIADTGDDWEIYGVYETERKAYLAKQGAIDAEIYSEADLTITIWPVK